MRFLVLLLLVVFATTGCATTGGRYVGPNPYPGELGRVVAGNLALTCPGDVFIGPPVNRCLRHLTNIGPRFAGYPMYAGGSGGRLLSCKEKKSLLYGGVGAGAGALVGRLFEKTTLGALIGLGGGVVTSTLVGCKDSPQVIQQPSHAPSGSGRENGWNPVLENQNREGMSPWFGSHKSCLDQGKFVLKNKTGEVLRIFKDGRPFAVLLPGRTECAEPFGEYTGQMVTAGRSADGYSTATGTPLSKPKGQRGGVWVWE